MDTNTTDAIAARRRWMRLLARASEARLAAALAEIEPAPEYTLVRAPEVGLSLVRGRISGVAQQFNMGEMTMTRCVARLADGRQGFAYLAGREPRRAELAAVFDALLQDPAQLDRWDAPLLQAIERELAQARAARQAETDRTKVEFFTMERGDA